MKKRGFTLIELLAVIVILAIIAIIVTPTILGVIETAKKGAAESSALGYIDAVEKYMALSELDSTKTKLQIGQTYEVNGTDGINNLITIKGEKPTSGTIKIGSNNTVEEAKLVIDNYNLECTNSKCEVEGKTETPDDEVVVTYPTILEKAKTLVYAEDGQTCKTDGTTYNYMGGCYIKGASDNNYVWYNGFMWRIMGINSDGTVRLITDENVTALAYGPENSGLTYKENEGYIHDWLNEYFYDHLNSTKDIIQKGVYFCSESTNGQKITEGRTTCTSGNEINTKMGIISIDEYLLAGTSSSYLNIGQTIKTMSPYSDANSWGVDNNGSATRIDITYMNGIRPIINVNSFTSITSGDGTNQNFYVLEENKSTNVTGTISEVVTSGEYVNLEGHTYRVVRKTTDGIKLILDEFYEEVEETPYLMQYNETTGNNTFVLTSGIGAKLNGIDGDNGLNVITWLGLSNSDKIIETTYYQGDGFGLGSNYQTTLKESNGIQTKVGLVQVGDILASQSSTTLTKKYTVASNYNNVNHYWTMSKCTIDTIDTNIWRLGINGSANYNGVTYTYSIRPVITVRNNLPITSGNGTWKNPYEI